MLLFKKVTKTFSIRKTRQIPPSIISLAKTGLYEYSPASNSCEWLLRVAKLQFKV